ncbi:MAG: iron ABC transporter permease [Clostridiaceae bacterium]|nr:iron ABC transporter permease [Clostridiaceae bacterium]
MGRKRFRFDFWVLITIIVFTLFALFMVWPLAKLLISGFIDPSTGEWSLKNFQTFFGRKYYTNAIFHSLYISCTVTILTVILGTLMAYLTSTFDIKGRGFIQILVIFSMMSPSFIGAYSWVILLGRNGLVTNFFANLGISLPTIYGFHGIVLVLTLKLYSFIYFYVSGAIKKVDPSMLEASQSLGCSPARNVVKMLIPLVLPSLLAAALMVFMTSIADFGTAMLIGEGYRVLPVLVYRAFMGENGSNANFAAAIAFVMVALTACLYFLQKYIINKKSFKMRSVKTIQKRPIKGFKAVLAHIYVYGLALLSVLPQMTVIVTAFLKTKGSRFVRGFSLDSFRSAWKTILSTTRNTYLYGATAIVLIVLIAVFVAYLSVRKRNALTSLLDVVTVFPYIISGSILGIMLLLCFNTKPLILSGSAAIIIVAFIIRRLPHTLRSSVGVLYQISPSTEEAAISLGSSPQKAFFKVTFMLMVPGIATGAIMSWVTVINELSASLILYTGGTKTLSVAVYEQVSRGNYGAAAAIASILMLTTIISLAVFMKATGSKEYTM